VVLKGDKMKTVLFTVSYLLEVDENLLKGTDDAEAFRETVFQKLSKHGRKKVDANHSAKWNSSLFVVLDPENMNCGKCSNCGAWTTDREKDSIITGLSNGATYDGALLCDECLPRGHRWAF
jgi:hypothetical protein